MNWHAIRGRGPLKGKTALAPNNALSLAHKFQMDAVMRSASMAGAPKPKTSRLMAHAYARNPEMQPSDSELVCSYAKVNAACRASQVWSCPSMSSGSASRSGLSASTTSPRRRSHR